VAYFQPPKSLHQSTTLLPQSTTNSPQKHHNEITQNPKTPLKNAQKGALLLQKTTQIFF